MSRSVALVEINELYNYLQNTDAHALHRIQNYVLLLDCRERREYDESHIVTAQHINVEDTSAVILPPFGADMGCRDHVIVYDSATTRLDEVSRANVCAQSIASYTSRNPVKVLKGGYEAFTAFYPFLRSKKVFHMPREFESIKLYPIEVISPLLLYLGDSQQGSDEILHKDLHIRALIKCFDSGQAGESRMSRRSVASYISQNETSDPNAKPAEYYFDLPDDEDVPENWPSTPENDQVVADPEIQEREEIDRTQESDVKTQVRFENNNQKSDSSTQEQDKYSLRDQFLQAVQIIELHERQKQAVLIYSKRGVSRAIAVTLAYLMYRNRSTLQDAVYYLKQRTNRIRPSRRLLEGLSDVEEYVRGHRVTNIDYICI